MPARPNASGIYAWWGDVSGSVHVRMLWQVPPAHRIWFPWEPAPHGGDGPSLAFSSNDGPLAWNVLLAPGCASPAPRAGREGGRPSRPEGRVG